MLRCTLGNGFALLRCHHSGLLALPGPSSTDMRTSLQAQDIFQLDHILMKVSSTLLTTFAQSLKGKVVQLPTKRCKGIMIEVMRQNVGFYLESIMNHNASQLMLAATTSLVDGPGLKRDEGFILGTEHIHETSDKSEGTTVVTKRKERVSSGHYIMHKNVSAEIGTQKKKNKKVCGAGILFEILWRDVAPINQVMSVSMVDIFGGKSADGPT